MENRRQDDTKIEVLTERVENWMESTTEYRKSLCSKITETNSKIDKMTDKMNNLPCRERIEGTKSIKLQLKALWILVSATLLGIISEWIHLK